MKSKPNYTIIGDNGTIDYLGNDTYLAVINGTNITYRFHTRELPEWLKIIEAHSDKYLGITTSEI